jgi:hypothetical protein
MPEFAPTFPATRGDLSATLEGVWVLPDGKLAVDLAVQLDRDLGARLTSAAIGVRKRRGWTRWLTATPSTSYLDADKTTQVRLESGAPTAVAARDRLFIYAYLASDAGDIEIGPPARQPVAMAATVAVTAAFFWLFVGPAAGAAVLLLGSFSGWQAMRFTSRPKLPRQSLHRLVRFWPAAALGVAIVAYKFAGGASDLSNHDYSAQARPFLIVLAVFLILVWGSRRKVLRRLTRPLRGLRDVTQLSRIALLLLLVGLFMSLAPSTRAAKKAAQAFCRRQKTMSVIHHRPGRITLADAQRAFSALPNIQVRRRNIPGLGQRITHGLIPIDFLTSSGRYWLGTLSIYATPADASDALSLTGVVDAASGQPLGQTRTTQLQNVLLAISTTDYNAQKCTLLGRLQRLR